MFFVAAFHYLLSFTQLITFCFCILLHFRHYHIGFSLPSILQAPPVISQTWQKSSLAINPLQTTLLNPDRWPFALLQTPSVAACRFAPLTYGESKILCARSRSSFSSFAILLLSNGIIGLERMHKQRSKKRRNLILWTKRMAGHQTSYIHDNTPSSSTCCFLTMLEGRHRTNGSL